MKKYILLLVLSIALHSLRAQQEFTSYYMDALPQTGYSNPAKTFNGKFFIGLPGISSTYLMYSNSSFAWSDVVNKRNDSLVFGLPNLISNLSPTNYMSLAAQSDILSFGFRIGDRSSLSFNVSEKVRFKFLYPKDLIQFIDQGNSGFENNTANFDGMGINMTHYREYGVAFNRTFLDERLVLGARLKYLYGMENIDSKKTEIEIYTDPITYEMKASGSIIINSSGLNDGMEDTQDYLLNRKNTGFGIDLGATFKVTDKIELNASVVDLGFIEWKHDVKNYVNDGSTFEFSGIDIDDFILKKNVDSTNNSSLQRVLDSLDEAFNLDETNEAYRSNLIAQIYLGGTYQIGEKIKAGVLIQNEYFKGKINPSLTLSYNHKFNKWFHATASYTVINNSYNNVGGGIVLHPGPVQFYIVADNILGAIQPQNARHMQVRTGINLVFGKGKINDVSRRERKKLEDVKQEEKEIPTVPSNEEVIPSQQEEIPTQEGDTFQEEDQTPIEEVDSTDDSNIEQDEITPIETNEQPTDETSTPEILDEEVSTPEEINSDQDDIQELEPNNTEDETPSTEEQSTPEVLDDEIE